MATTTIYCHHKLMLLTDEEEMYYAPPAELYKSYIYCKVKTEEDIERVVRVCETDEKLQIALLFAPNLTDLKTKFESIHTPIVAAGGIVVNEKNEVLLIERKGKWDLPKGKADAGETPEQTALREVSEETGLQHLIIQDLAATTQHTYKEEKEQLLKTTFWYYMQGNSTDTLIPQVEEKITAIKWVPRAELKQYITATYPSIAQLLEKL